MIKDFENGNNNVTAILLEDLVDPWIKEIVNEVTTKESKERKLILENIKLMDPLPEIEKGAGNFWQSFANLCLRFFNKLTYIMKKMRYIFDTSSK